MTAIVQQKRAGPMPHALFGMAAIEGTFLLVGASWGALLGGVFFPKELYTGAK